MLDTTTNGIGATVIRGAVGCLDVALFAVSDLVERLKGGLVIFVSDLLCKTAALDLHCSSVVTSDAHASPVLAQSPLGNGVVAVTYCEESLPVVVDVQRARHRDCSRLRDRRCRLQQLLICCVADAHIWLC